MNLRVNMMSVNPHPSLPFCSIQRKSVDPIQQPATTPARGKTTPVQLELTSCKFDRTLYNLTNHALRVIAQLTLNNRVCIQVYATLTGVGHIWKCFEKSSLFLASNLSGWLALSVCIGRSFVVTKMNDKLLLAADNSFVNTDAHFWRWMTLLKAS